jgi:predicted HTH domain antitoxin
MSFCFIRQYSGALSNPPLLVVSDIQRIRIIPLDHMQTQENRYTMKENRSRSIGMSVDLQKLAQEVHIPEAQLQEQADLLLLLDLYSKGAISSAAAARFLEISRGEFQTLASQHAIPIDDPNGDPVKESQLPL